MRTLIIAILFLLGTLFAQSQSVGINIDNSTPNPNAALDVKSNDKGILIPRLTTLEKNAFATTLTIVENGMMVFDTDQKQFYFWSDTEFQQINMVSWMEDIDGDTKIMLEENPDDDIIRFYAQDVERWKMEDARLEPVNSGGSIFIGELAGKTDDLNDRQNIAIGKNSLGTNEKGNDNIAIGTHASFHNVRSNIVSIGDSALYSNSNGTTNDIYGSDNTAIGSKSLRNNTTGFQNVALGNNALEYNTTGFGNTANGFQSLSDNTTGNLNTAMGNQAMRFNIGGHQNVAVGPYTLLHNRTGENNIALGLNAQSGNSTGNNNISLGSNALRNNTEGNSNVAIGVAALRLNDQSNIVAIGDSSLYYNSLGASGLLEGRYNTAVGSKTLMNNSTGFANSAFGFNALNENIQGFANTAFGTSALQFNTTGNSNVSIGSNALQRNTTGNQNVGLGLAALTNNIIGNDNTALGTRALFINNIGNDNTSVGSNSLRNNSSGSSNVALGADALRGNQTGSKNVAIGTAALRNSQEAIGQIAIGDSSLYNFNSAIGFNSGNIAIGEKSQRYSTTGLYNTSIGFNSLLSNNNSFGNSAFGYNALFYANSNSNSAFGYYSQTLVTTGEENSSLGAFSLYGNLTRNRRTAIGYSANSLGNNGNNTGLGNNADCTAAHQVRIGNSDVTSIGGYANWTNVSDGNFKTDVRENVVGLEFIKALRPVTYKLDLNAIHVFFQRNYGEEHSKEYLDPSNAGTMIRSGFIAQEVENIADELGYDFSGVDAPKNEKDFYGLRYAAFVVPLVKAVQEQQELIDVQRVEIAQQDAELLSLKIRMEKMEAYILPRTNQASEEYINSSLNEK